MLTIQLDAVDVIGPLCEPRLGPDSYDIAQREATDKIAIASLRSTAHFREDFRTQRIDVVLPGPYNRMSCKLSSRSLVSLYSQRGRRVKVMVESFLAWLECRMHGPCSVYRKVRSWGLATGVEVGGGAAHLPLDGAIHGCLLFGGVLWGLGVPVETLPTGLEPRPGSSITSPVLGLATPALVAAAQGENNLPARVLEGVSWTADPLLELGQGIVPTVREWLGLSSSEAVVAFVVVSSSYQTKWF